MREWWILFPRFADFFGSSSAHPLPHDVFHLFSVEGLVGEEIVHDRRQRRPVIFSIQQSIEPRGRLLQVGQAFTFERKKRSGRFPGELPIRCPLSDETGMEGLAAVDHFSDRTGQRHEDWTSREVLGR